MTIPPIVVAKGTTNLFANADYANQSIGTAGSRIYHGASYTLTFDSDVTKDGFISLKVERTNSGSFVFLSAPFAPANVPYVASAYVKGSGTASIFAQAWTNANSGSLVSSGTSSSNATLNMDTWQRLVSPIHPDWRIVDTTQHRQQWGLRYRLSLPAAG